MNLFKKPQKNKISLQFQNVELKDGIVPVIKIKGKIPDGSLGNIDCENIFSAISNTYNLPELDYKIVIYDFTEMEYRFGDSLGAYLWTLPSLLDGISNITITGDQNRDSIFSLYNFIGDWLPMTFMDSIPSAIDEIQQNTFTIQAILQKSLNCSQYGKEFQPNQTGTPVVVFGSRQTGQQFLTNKRFEENSDIDWGVVGGPQELALLILKASMMERDPKKHSPTKFFSTNEEAESQGYFIVQPQ
jgi:hypothetical protein